MAVPSGETWLSGEFRLAPDGRVGIVQGCRPHLEGEDVVLAVEGLVEVTPTVALAAGAMAAVTIATQVVAATGTGVDMGKVLYANAANKVNTVELNRKDG